MAKSQSAPISPVFESPRVFGVLDVLPSGVAAGDLNGDGLMDLAVAAGGCASETQVGGSVTILLNDGDWDTDGLEATLRLDFDDLCGGCCIGDKDVLIAKLNDDDHLDIAVAGVNDVGGGYVVLFLNDPEDPGDSFARETLAVGGGRYTRCIAAGAFDMDGDLDLAVGGLALDPNGAQVTVYENDGDAEFTEQEAFPSLSVTEIEDILVGKLADGDSRVDIVASHDGGNLLKVLRREPDPFEFEDRSLAGPSGNAFRYETMAAGRLNSDGLPEIVGVQIIPNGGSDPDDDVDVFRRDPDTGALIHVRPGDTYDFDRDALGIDIGHLNPGTSRDVVVGITGDNPGIGILLGNGDGTLSGSTLYTFSQAANQGDPVRVIAVDMNDDNQTDVVCTNSAGSVSVFLNNASAP